MPLDMDAIVAHLDRGWDLLHRGDLGGARVSASEILEIESNSPEGHTLMGAILAAEGEPEEAMENLRRAIDFEPEYLDAYLYAAELAIHTLGDLKAGLALCDEAEPLAVEPGDRVDLCLMRAEAHLLNDDFDRAGAALSLVPPPPYEEPAHSLRAARLHLDVGELEQAVELLRRAAEEETCQADAHYFWGVALEQQGELLEGLSHFVQAHQLDQVEPDPVWSMLPEELEKEVRQVVQGLPADRRQQLEDVPVSVHQQPPLELVAEGFDPRGLVFVSAVAHKSDKVTAGSPRPSCIFVYKRNVERLAVSRQEVPAAVEDALQQELGLLLE